MTFPTRDSISPKLNSTLDQTYTVPYALKSHSFDSFTLVKSLYKSSYIHIKTYTFLKPWYILHSNFNKRSCRIVVLNVFLDTFFVKSNANHRKNVMKCPKAAV